MKFKKSIYLTIIVFIFTTFFSFTPASASKKSTSIPKLQIVTQPQKEYKNGETISFVVTSPNYSGAVQYRVILYNGTTKKTTDLWKNAQSGYYYTGWQPSGNYCFEIHWPVSQMEPGAYSMTVLVRRVGAKVSYDSYVDTNSFWVTSNGINNNQTPSAVEIKTITFDDGTKYTGETVNGFPHGNGTLLCANGDKYVGEWRNNVKEGYGIYTWANGDKYEGQWKNNSMNGNGTYSYADGDTYEGEWKNNKKEGFGIFTWANGEKYEGQWKNDDMNGKGSYSFPNGEKYEGEWKDDELITSNNKGIEPPLVTGVTIVSNDTAKITWNSVSADYYKIYCSTSLNGTFKGVPNVDNNNENKYTGNWAEITFLNPGNSWTYYFKVTAVKNGIESTDSNIVYAKYNITQREDPNIPTGLWAKALSSSEVSIGWNNVFSADYYKIYYSNSIDGPYTPLPNGTSNNENYYRSGKDLIITLYNPPKSWVLYLKITAVINGIETGYSNIVRVSYP